VKPKIIESTLSVNGKTVPCVITITVRETDLSFEDITAYMDDAAKEDISRSLESGALSFCDVLVEAFACNSRGVDSVGAVAVERPEDVDSYITDCGMIQNAKDALEETMRLAFEALSPIFGGVRE
jgi:hypothetical protein